MCSAQTSDRTCFIKASIEAGVALAPQVPPLRPRANRGAACTPAPPRGRRGKVRARAQLAASPADSPRPPGPLPRPGTPSSPGRAARRLGTAPQPPQLRGLSHTSSAEKGGGAKGGGFPA